MKKMYTNSNSAFPSQVVPDAEKASWEYGSQVASAIETEWFNQGRTHGNRYLTSWNNFKVINNANAYLELTLKDIYKDFGDHDLFLFDIKKFKTNSEYNILTFQDLIKNKIIL